MLSLYHINDMLADILCMIPCPLNVTQHGGYFKDVLHQIAGIIMTDFLFQLLIQNIDFLILFRDFKGCIDIPALITGHRFLQHGDKAVVVVYPEDVYSQEEIIKRVGKDNLEEDDISVLIQEVIV